MRILLGIDTFGLIGGSERYGIQLCEELRSRGHEVGILCGARQPETPAPPQVIVLPAYSTERATKRELAELEGAIRAFAPEVLVLLTSRGRAATRRMTGLTRWFPVVRFVQDHALFCPGLTKMHADGRNCVEPFGLPCLRHYFFEGGCTAFRTELHRSRLDGLGGVWKWKRGLDTARSASALVVASGYMRRELEAVGIPSERIALLPYFSLSASLRAETRAPDPHTRNYVEREGPPVLLVPARLTLPEKGLDRLLDAVARVGLPLRVVVAGTGPAEEALKQQARDLSLNEPVHFAGWQDAASLEWLYSHCHLVAFPSMWNEPFGLVGIEAMAHAKPVVAFDVGGVREWLLPEVTGLISPRGDIEALSTNLRRLVTSPELRKSLGQAGKARHAERFTPERHLEGFEALLARICANS